MGLFEHFPYSNFHELNLDILVKKMKELEKMVDQLRKSFAAPSVVSVAAEMTDINKIYIYVGSEPGYQTNHWYYYSTATNTWTDGGAYGALDLDTSLDADSHNAVENSVITTALAGKQDSLSLPLTIANGGTAANSQLSARQNLGAMDGYPTLLYDGGKVTSGTIPLSDGLSNYKWILVIGVTNTNFVSAWFPENEANTPYAKLILTQVGGNWDSDANRFQFNAYVELEPTSDTTISINSVYNNANFVLGVYKIYGFLA